MVIILTKNIGEKTTFETFNESFPSYTRSWNKIARPNNVNFYNNITFSGYLFHIEGVIYRKYRKLK